MKNVGLLICSFLFVTCSDDGPGTEGDPRIESENLIWVWHLEPFPAQTELRETISYEFFETGTFEVLNSVEDITENQIVGYRYRATGNYSLSGNRLTMDRNDIYLNNNVSGFSATVEELGLSTDSWTETVEITLNGNGNSLTFDYDPCNDTANCIGTLTFLRVQ